MAFLCILQIQLFPSFFKGIEIQGTFDYDIAILELSEEVDLNIYTPACLAKKGDNFSGQTATAAGWGFLDKEETISTDVPHEVQARVADCGPGNELIECMEKVNGKEITRVRTYKNINCERSLPK